MRKILRRALPKAGVTAMLLMLGACGFVRESLFGEQADGGVGFSLNAAQPDGGVMRSAYAAVGGGGDASLANSVMLTAAGEGGEWGSTVFVVTRTFQAASGQSCKEVFLLHEGRSAPEQRLTCQSGNVASFAAAVF